MEERLIFVTGMFRSGTTLLARLLNAHPEVAFASDPFAELFKEFRNTVAEGLWPTATIDRSAPLDDYFFCPQKLALMRQIQSTSLNVPLGTLPLPAIRQKIADRSKAFSPLMEPHFSLLQGSTFAELLSQGFEAIRRAYGKPGTRVTGFKETWGGEFVPHVLRQFPSAKVVYVMRDPRAVAASKNVMDEKYPWVFLARQWRKLAAFGWMLTHGSGFESRVKLLRFEDLIRDPEPQIRELCQFLEIDFNPKLIDPTQFRDGAGKPWEQNSSHFKETRAFNSKSLEKWRDVLRPDEILFIEALCYAEMRSFDYAPALARSNAIPASTVFNPPQVLDSELAGWIRPYCPSSDDTFREMGLEFTRSNLLRDGAALENDVKERLCLSAPLFDHLRAILNSEN